LIKFFYVEWNIETLTQLIILSPKVLSQIKWRMKTGENWTLKQRRMIIDSV